MKNNLKTASHGHTTDTKQILAAALTVCLALSLAACGKGQGGGAESPSGTTAQTESGETGQEIHANETLQNAASADNAGETAAALDSLQDTSDDGIEPMQDVCIRFKNDNEWRDYKELLVNYDYELLTLGKDSEEKYPELKVKVAVINDLIATDEGNTYMMTLQSVQKLTDVEIQEKKDNNEIPHKAHWNIFVRRADTDVFSLVTRDTIESPGDYNRVICRGYNYRSKTGEEIKLSDVVADEDAFYSLVAEKANKNAEEFLENGEKASITAADIKEQMEMKDRSGWTLDPQGISVWLGSHTLLPVDICVTVLYSEDSDGSIFKDEFSKHSPKTWAMYIPMSKKTYFDAEDDGTVDVLTVNENRDRNEGETYEYCKGLSMDYNGRHQDFDGWDDLYDVRLSLIHMYGETILLNTCSEYDYSFMDTYAFTGGGVADTGYIEGNPMTISDVEMHDEDYASPDCLLMDPGRIRVACLTDVLSTCGSQRDYILKENGKFEPVEPYYTILEGSRYTISPKIWLRDVPVVDELTHETTTDTVTLRPGDRITMEFTDNENWTDCRTADGKLVRIEVHSDEDMGRYVLSGSQKVLVYEAFEDMMFAG